MLEVELLEPKEACNFMWGCYWVMMHIKFTPTWSGMEESWKERAEISKIHHVPGQQITILVTIEYIPDDPQEEVAIMALLQHLWNGKSGGP